MEDRVIRRRSKRNQQTSKQPSLLPPKSLFDANGGRERERERKEGSQSLSQAGRGHEVVGRPSLSTTEHQKEQEQEGNIIRSFSPINISCLGIPLVQPKNTYHMYINSPELTCGREEPIDVGAHGLDTDSNIHTGALLWALFQGPGSQSDSPSLVASFRLPSCRSRDFQGKGGRGGGGGGGGEP